MTLKANRGPAATANAADDAQDQNQQVEPTQGQNLPVDPNKVQTLADLNPLLGGLDGMGDGEAKNRVVVDGSEFLYKKLDYRTGELIVSGSSIKAGEKYWQWWPAKDASGQQLEEGTMCMSFDHVTSADGVPCVTCPHLKDKSCKMKYDLTWVEPDETQGEGATMDATLTMSTTGAFAFIDFVKALAAGKIASDKDMEYLRKPIDARKPNGPNNLYVDPASKQLFNPGRPVGLHEIVFRAIVQRRSEKNKTTNQQVSWGQPCFQAIGFVDGITA